MDVAVKELGKWLLNFALVVSATLVLQPLIQKDVHQSYTGLGIVSTLILLAGGFSLIWLGELIRKKNLEVEE
ncbi:MAG: hypothetical protein GXO18_05075 [Aquificae bacterium]|nr:hypothetical protein [Aquificota bacterium]